MKRFLYFVMGLSAVIAALFLIGPYEPVDLATNFDDAGLGADLDAYLSQREAVFDDIVPGAAKRIQWAGEPGAKTAVSIVYLHGFSATAEEIRPVPDQVAEALGANLYFARLAGHGRSADAMAGPIVNDWMIDMAETMAIGRALGDEVIILSMSTGGTIAALGALDSNISRGLKGITFVSPNFSLRNPASVLLTFPAARYWAPLISGQTVGFTPMNEEQAAHWTERYPAVAVTPMAAMVKTAYNTDYSGLKTPALLIYSDADTVVSAKATDAVVESWGGKVTVSKVVPGAGIEPMAHLLAGDIVSPAGTAPTVEKILDWAQGL